MEIRWTRNGVFSDTPRGFRANGPGVYDVPNDVAAEYLNHRLGGWERVADDQSQSQSQAEPESEAEAEAEASAQSDTADEATEDEDGAESSSNPDGSNSGGELSSAGEKASQSASGAPDNSDSQSSGADFDAAAFVGDHWRTVTNQIEAGRVDDHLSAIRTAETNRDGGARDSVLSTINDRQDAISGSQEE